MKEPAIVLERNPSWGGLVDNFVVDGFRFDNGPHLSFTNNQYVKGLFAESSTYHSYFPEPWNYYAGVWIKHPAQNNLFPLSISEKVRIISEFVNVKAELPSINNYEEWLRYQYGDYFAERFPMRYTRKIWTVEPRDLTTSWIDARMYRPSLEEMLRGALTDETPNTYYAKEMRYPTEGGYKAFVSKMARDVEIRLNAEVTAIDPFEQKVRLADGRIEPYSELISTLPLPEVVKLLPQVPIDVLQAADSLMHTSVALISIGLKNPPPTKSLWSYIYDEEMPACRVHYPHLKSSNNVPIGKGSMQFEVYFGKHKPLKIELDALREQVIKMAAHMKLLELSEIEVVHVKAIPYAS
ncbi:MAG: FAD-dependent oxidoreductase, partial [Bdellovibrionales bacterium]|nr:FAD-dependent oxidoreductase [Bdellovibrionales bacterium]